MAGRPGGGRDRDPIRSAGHALGAFLGLVAAIATSVVPATAACVPGDGAALLILDASYSMLQLIGGVTRFTVARQALNASVELFPDGAKIALRLYGSESQAARADCTDTVLKVPFAPAAGNRALIKLALASSLARGVTPIAYALEQASRDFPEDATSRTIVLITDGGETCGGNDCDIAGRLGRQGFVINTVGFQADARGRRQLQCIAMASGGQYFPVPTVVQLPDKITQALGVCPVAIGPPPRRRAQALG
jgi:Ca-activated chloride channel family protein